MASQAAWFAVSESAVYTRPTASQALEEPGTIEQQALEELLRQVADGALTISDAQARLRTLPYEDLGFAKLDHHRSLRKGFPEVVLAQGKTPEQVAAIVQALAMHASRLLVTRASAAHAEAVHAVLPEVQYHSLPSLLILEREPDRQRLPGILVLSAGTADLPVAEEAALTAEVMGCAVERVHDVGVAGLHRLLDHLPQLHAARVVIAVAGMEGALPSVVAGLVAAPVVAVPTSVGYGASFGGVAALLAMLNSCAGGVGVVNIDNGFGAGYLAALINGVGRE